LVSFLREGSLYCFCLLAESYETINQSYPSLLRMSARFSHTVKIFQEGDLYPFILKIGL